MSRDPPLPIVPVKETHEDCKELHHFPQRLSWIRFFLHNARSLSHTSSQIKEVYKEKYSHIMTKAQGENRHC